jgi:hypothetical protein
MVDKVGIVQCENYQDVIRYITTKGFNGFEPCVKFIDWHLNVVYILVADYWDVL